MQNNLEIATPNPVRAAADLSRLQSKLRYTERALETTRAKLERVKGQRNTWRAIAKELIKNRKGGAEC